MTSEETVPSNRNQAKKSDNLRAIVAFWIFGLCNNFAYVVMLTAAEDILKTTHETINNERKCNRLSTGVILIADIVPCMIVKIIFPFLPYLPGLYVLLSIATSMVGLLLVAFSEQNFIIVIVGVILISFSSGLGEITFLQYSYYYSENTVSSWSSGTGGAGIFGSFSYLILIYFGIKKALLSMMSVPLAIAVSYWVLLPKITHENTVENIQMDTFESESRRNTDKAQFQADKLTFSQKLKIFPSIIPFMIPIGLVYFFEYLINQGLFELVYFENTALEKSEQYRWLQVLYQLGVFISRSSVNIIEIKFVWIFAIFQILNFIVYLCEGIFFFMPNIWYIFALTFWEGLLGGGAYVNTFYKVRKTTSPDRRQFFLGTISLADAFGISCAGFAAIPLHNAICATPKPTRLL